MLVGAWGCPALSGCLGIVLDGVAFVRSGAEDAIRESGGMCAADGALPGSVCGEPGVSSGFSGSGKIMSSCVTVGSALAVCGCTVSWGSEALVLGCVTVLELWCTGTAP